MKGVMMRKWKLVVNEDLSLRTAIDTGDFNGVETALKSVCNEVIELIMDEEIVEEFQDLLEEIEMSAFDEDDEQDEDCNEETRLDFLLAELYDLCDECDIFIAVAPMHGIRLL